VRVLELDAGAPPRERGRAHGETFRGPIGELAQIRLGLTVRIGGFDNPARVLSLASEHLPVLEAFDADLHAELLGIAEGAAIEPERIVLLNHYTDLRDLGPATRRTAEGEDDCSAVWTRAHGASLLGQTWDMHGSAMPYVMMLGVPGDGGHPGAWVFSIVGCLGMTGMNDAGLGITINNLKSLDARVGIVWPALVRRVLRERGAEAARDVVLGSPLGSGHCYLVADRTGRAFAIETSGTERKVVFDGSEDAYVHTNHCLDDELDACSTVSPESTTHDRYAALVAGLEEAPIADRADLWRRLGSHAGCPRSVCTHLAGPDRPHAMLTCGALAMDLAARDLWAAPGCVHRARPHVFRSPR